MPIDIPQKLRDQRGELRPLGGGVQVPRRVQIQKQLGKEMGQKLQKELLATAQMVCLDQSVILDILVRYWLHSGKHTSKRSTNSTQLPFSKSILAILPFHIFFPPYPSHPLRSPILSSPSSPFAVSSPNSPKFPTQLPVPPFQKRCPPLLASRSCPSRSLKAQKTLLSSHQPSPACPKPSYTRANQPILNKTPSFPLSPL